MPFVRPGRQPWWLFALVRTTGGTRSVTESEGKCQRSMPLRKGRQASQKLPLGGPRTFTWERYQARPSERRKPGRRTLPDWWSDSYVDTTSDHRARQKGRRASEWRWERRRWGWLKLRSQVGDDDMEDGAYVLIVSWSQVDGSALDVARHEFRGPGGGMI